MNRRTAFIIAIIAALLLALALFFLLRRSTVSPDNIQPSMNEPTITEPVDVGADREIIPVAPGTGSTTPVARPDGTSAVRSFASAFAERFGSFSNQTDFVNIMDLQGVMTPRMQTWAQSFVADARSGADGSGAIYAGTTTRALISNVEAFDDAMGTARVRVGTQRQQSAAGAPAEVYRQDIVITLVRTNGEWRVDSAEWQPR